MTVITNLSALDSDAFWTVIDNRNWMHPFDAAGRRCHYRDIPKTVSKLADDPFRSLAGELRRAGGFAKDTTPFSEFLWADFLRRQIKPKIVERDFDRAVVEALRWRRARRRDTCRAGAVLCPRADRGEVLCNRRRERTASGAFQNERWRASCTVTLPTIRSSAGAISPGNARATNRTSVGAVISRGAGIPSGRPARGTRSPLPADSQSRSRTSSTVCICSA